MSDRDEVTAGRRASAELQMVAAVFAKLRQEMLERIAGSAISDSLNREKLYFGIQQLDAVKTALNRMVDAGEAADARLIIEQTLLDTKVTNAS